MSFGDDLERERERVVRLVRHASCQLGGGDADAQVAPPDAGFAARGCGSSRRPRGRAGRLGAGSRGRPALAARAGRRRGRPYELRPGTGRRGPEELWLRFDAAVKELNRAIGGPGALKVASAFGAMAEAAAELAEAIAREEDVARGGARARPQRRLRVSATRPAS